MPDPERITQLINTVGNQLLKKDGEALLALGYTTVETQAGMSEEAGNIVDELIAHLDEFRRRNPLDGYAPTTAPFIFGAIAAISDRREAGHV